jgi:hypothetical protein
MKTVLSAGLPLPSASRSKVMRLPPFAAAPARAFTFPAMKSLGRKGSVPGLLLSTTRMSPLGRV